MVFLAAASVKRSTAMSFCFVSFAVLGPLGTSVAVASDAGTVEASFGSDARGSEVASAAEHFQASGGNVAGRDWLASRMNQRIGDVAAPEILVSGATTRGRLGRKGES
eukprot:TRINITY_DN55793_c0_g1_i2.p2 TRINITY_DN55793_c0_g1~~TRINITY_DN55793_c0_g1_i2.p2  ORF type:complete len:108 (+),score=14.65 TRINITY_DN55793_c0_g1_i2:105-428(+)